MVQLEGIEHWPTLTPKCEPSFYDTTSREFKGLPTLEDPWFIYFMQQQEYQKVIAMTNPMLAFPYDHRWARNR